MEKQELIANLANFTGTEHYYQHFPGCKYTDGVKYLAETAGCYWLLDVIFSYRRKDPFQIWTLVVKDKKAVVTMKEDSDTPVLIKQEIEYTDFPLDEISLWLIDGVLILPSEY